MQNYYAHGKVLLSSEYAVLDGAKAIALPLKKGQRFSLTPSSAYLEWCAYGVDGEVWFQTEFDESVQAMSPSPEASYLAKILKQLDFPSSLKIESTLEFDRNWGLGSSSTLISFLSELTSKNPYEILDLSFGGSGYDIACATAKGPILFSNRTSEDLSFVPECRDQLYFVYLNEKMNSREAIKMYRERNFDHHSLVRSLTDLSLNLIENNSYDNFVNFIVEHENRLSKTLMMTPIKERLFKDFKGEIKSLGAWGGDFVLALSKESETDVKNYFIKKGHPHIFSYRDFVL